MPDGYLILAAVLGIIGAAAGNRAAWPLLASLALCNGLPHLGYNFDMAFWLFVDLAVIGVIVWLGITLRHTAIIVLFLPAWGFYFASPEIRFIGTLACVILQFVLTLPWVRFHRFSKRGMSKQDSWSEFDLRVAA